MRSQSTVPCIASGAPAVLLQGRRPRARAGSTHGFTGSASVSSQSSILLVCSLMASKGLGSLVASARPGPPNGLWLPRW